MKRLRELRKDQGWSQKLLADQLNVAQNTISQWERGEREPDFDTLSKIADLFKVSAGYLLGHTNDPIDWENYDGYIPEHFNGDAKKYHMFLDAVDEGAKIDPSLQRPTGSVNMSDVSFAFAGEVKDLTDEQMESVIAFVKLLKEQNKKRG